MKYRSDWHEAMCRVFSRHNIDPGSVYEDGLTLWMDGVISYYTVHPGKGRDVKDVKLLTLDWWDRNYLKEKGHM